MERPKIIEENTMPIQTIEIQPGAVFASGADRVRVAVNHGLRAGLRLDQYPPNGLVYAAWFRAEQDVADFLNLGGHVLGASFQSVPQ